MIKNIIDSTNEEYVNKSILYLKDKYNIDLPIYKKDKGLPIGNMTSQILACLYLDELDKYIINDLGIKHYIIYMDDGVLFFKNKEYLKYCLSKIEKIVNKYKLKLNNKTKYNFKHKLNNNNLNSYIGHLKYGNCRGLIYKTLEAYNEK